MHKKKPAITGNICNNWKLLFHGSKTKIDPVAPIIKANNLQKPTNSPEKIIDKIVTNIGNVYKPAAIWDIVRLGDAEKKQNIHNVMVQALI